MSTIHNKKRLSVKLLNRQNATILKATLFRLKNYPELKTQLEKDMIDLSIELENYVQSVFFDFLVKAKDAAPSRKIGRPRKKTLDKIHTI